MVAHIEYLDDPLNPRGWVAEPVRRRLAVAFPGVPWRVRAVGMVESWDAYDGPEVPGGRNGMAAVCARLAEEHGMPIDEYLWFDEPPTGSWPACRAVAAAGLQDDALAARTLRACREATFLRREAVSDEATLEAVLGRVRDLDVEAALTALGDGSADDAFEAHREAAASVDADGATLAGDRVALPTLVVRDGDDARAVSGLGTYEQYEAAVAAVTGLSPATEVPDAATLLERFSVAGWVSPTEIAAATGGAPGAVTAALRDLVEAGLAEERTFAASAFFRSVDRADGDDGDDDGGGGEEDGGDGSDGDGDVDDGGGGSDGEETDATRATDPGLPHGGR